MTDFTAVEKLVHGQEIIDAIHRYARAIDRVDAELLKSVFWEEGAYCQIMNDACVHEAAESIVGWMNETFAVTQHALSTTNLAFADAERAKTETYFTAFHLTRPKLDRAKLESIIGARRIAELGGDYSESYEIVVGGRYLDVFERRNGAWRIHTRRLLLDWTTTDVGRGLRKDEGLILSSNTRAWSTRDQSDPSYLL